MASSSEQSMIIEEVPSVVVREMLRRRAASAVVALLLAACSDSHMLNDASMMDGSVDATAADDGIDLGQDATADASQPDCGVVAGNPACSGACAATCRAPTYCHAPIGLCLPRRDMESCRFATSGTSYGEWCQTGGPCAATGSGTPSDPFVGACVGASLCLAAAEAHTGTFSCVYSNGANVATGPPTGGCPAASGDAVYCGGACAGVACPVPFDGITGDGRTFNVSDYSCVGLSDQRGYGVCSWSPWSCSLTSSTMQQTEFDACNIAYASHPCGCLTMLDGPAPVGWIVAGDACRTYRDAFPATVSCTDADGHGL